MAEKLTSVKIEGIWKDLLCSALEGGSNYWYTIDTFVYPQDMKEAERVKLEFKHLDLPLLKDGALLIEASDYDNDKRTDKLWKLDLAVVKRGWKILQKEEPRHYADAITERSDADTGDVFLQLCLFGKVIFG